MAMDFFESQDVARRKTGRLVILFILAVIAIIAAVHVLVGLLWGYVGRDPETHGLQWSHLLDWQLLGIVAGSTILVVGGGSLFKIAQLHGGGRVVAETLGGRLVHASTNDPDARKALNVVDEMAIASGIPVPPVYLLEHEKGINAFAAGFAPGDAVIGVTRGCIEQLSRDELQGVIAHEFSHILNGDMRLNIRLIGVLHGILVIGIIGYFMFRSSFYSGHRRSRSSKDGSPVPLLALGAGLAIIGYVGTFFGNLIKAAVSRQREFLADASAVQFTRNPHGIAGALKRIGGFTSGSKLESPGAPEASHMFFARGVASALGSLSATHPPLPERIRRIEPNWDGGFTKGDRRERKARAPAAQAAGFAAAPPYVARAAEPAPAVSQIGQLTEAHVDYAGQLIRSLPAAVTAAAREPYGARAVVYALLIDKEPEPRRAQLARLAEYSDQGVSAETERLLPLVEQLGSEVRLPLVDLLIPTLRELSPAQYDIFKRNVDELAKADKRVDLFEWTLGRILLHHLDPHFVRTAPPRVQYYALSRLQRECEVLLSTLAYSGHKDHDQARSAFELAAPRLGLPKLGMTPVNQCGLKELDSALDALALVAPRLKKQLVESCAACVGADREVTVKEAELLRGICDALACPMPPLLPGQRLI